MSFLNSTRRTHGLCLRPDQTRPTHKLRTCRDWADKSTTWQSLRTCRRPKWSVGLVWSGRVCVVEFRNDPTRPDQRQSGMWTLRNFISPRTWQLKEKIQRNRNLTALDGNNHNKSISVRIAFSKVATSLFTPWLSLINASPVSSLPACRLIVPSTTDPISVTPSLILNRNLTPASLELSGVSPTFWESWHLLETEYYVCHLLFATVTLRHLSSMFVFLRFSVLSFYCDNILALDFYIEHACALVVVYTCFYFYCTLCTITYNNNNNNNGCFIST